PVSHAIWDMRLAVGRFVHRQLLRAGIDLTPLLDRSLAPMVRKVMTKSGMQLNGFEAAQIFSQVSALVSKLDGSLAECFSMRQRTSRACMSGCVRLRSACPRSSWRSSWWMTARRMGPLTAAGQYDLPPSDIRSSRGS